MNSTEGIEKIEYFERGTGDEKEYGEKFYTPRCYSKIVGYVVLEEDYLKLKEI